MKLLRPTSAFLGLALALACAPYTVRYDYDARASYTSLKTYDWYAASKRAKEKAQGVEDPIMDRRVKRAVEQQLLSKGFRQEATGEPDFLVTYYPVYQERHYRTTTAIGTGWGYRPWGLGATAAISQDHRYKEGTIVLEIVDFKTNQLIWRAAAEGALTDLNSPEAADEAVESAVRRMLGKFPPPPRH